MSEKLDVLLVGEGNFSFSAALCESDDAVRITATCLQTEQQTAVQENAAQNVQRLRDRGCTVLFEVDCTLLSEHENIRQHLYDRVIFNFPHCGRKSGVKKNRALLVKFFISCVKVLKADGEVHVALCNGQGGTPHDNPVREWHNSWQVVAMAAEAGLILSEVRPFDRHQLQGYRSTGYRSQDKGFHVEGALTHVFTRSLPYTRPDKLKLSSRIGRVTVSYELPEELSEYVNRNFLGRQSQHPVKIVLDQILREIKSSWPVCEVSGNFPEMISCSSSSSDETLASCSDLSPSDIYWIKATRTVPCDQQPSSSSNFALRPSLLVHRKEIMQREDFSPGTFYALSGLVFRRVAVSPMCAPAFYQLLLVAVLPSASRPVVGLQGVLEALLSPYDVSFTTEQLGQEEQVWLSSQSVENFARITSIPVVGSELQLYPSCVLTLLLNLDRLAALTCSIPDWRLLWSSDRRFLAQVPAPFRPFSLHPPSHTHDVSFWVEPDSFDELEFHQVVRTATCGAVRDVQLVDRFSHPHMGHVSLCYRLVYQSPDRALSRSQVLELQEQLRALLPQRLKVTLR